MEVTRKGEEMERRRRPHIQETKGRKLNIDRTGVQRAWRGKRSASRQREWRGGGALSGTMATIILLPLCMYPFLSP